MAQAQQQPAAGPRYVDLSFALGDLRVVRSLMPHYQRRLPPEMQQPETLPIPVDVAEVAALVAMHDPPPPQYVVRRMHRAMELALRTGNHLHIKVSCGRSSGVVESGGECGGHKSVSLRVK
jgi:hypothetical protein